MIPESEYQEKIIFQSFPKYNVLGENLYALIYGLDNEK